MNKRKSELTRLLLTNARVYGKYLANHGFEREMGCVAGIDSMSMWRRDSDGAVAEMRVRNLNVPVFLKDGKPFIMD